MIIFTLFLHSKFKTHFLPKGCSKILVSFLQSLLHFPLLHRQSIRKQNQRLFSMISGENKLELRLAPPSPEADETQTFLAYNCNHNIVRGAKTAFEDTLRSKVLAGNADGFSKPSCSIVAEVLCADEDTFSVSGNTAVSDGSNKRTAPAPAVGWPPIGSFRKNITSISLSKPASKPDQTPNEKISGKSESLKTDLFIKINMEGVPVGRKINIRAYNSYEELSFGIDELFKGLLSVRRDSSTGGSNKKMEGSKVKSDEYTLVKSNEYTLLYEDNEGDRMLVGDVPWHMFASTVKKLLVMKSSKRST